MHTHTHTIPQRAAHQICCRKHHHPGVLALYSGLKSPLLGNAPMNAIVFGANGNANRTLDRLWGPRDTTGGPDYARLYLAGTWAGVLQSFVAW